MSNQTPTPETVIRRAIEASMRRMNTAEPGVIESYDATSGTVTVQPLVMRIRVDETGERLTERAPAVPDVPVYFSGGGGSRLTFPVKRGDVCLLIYASQPIDQWAALGREVDPKAARHHHLSDAIALVGLAAPASNPNASGAATVLEGADIRLATQFATEAVIKGNAWLTAFNTLIAAIASAVGGISGSAGAAITSALTTFDTASTTYLSTLVKVG